MAMARREREHSMALPTVTVFGAGIAGLTVAHELAERGFTVQVVEPEESQFAEYQCQVGGLAANQFARARKPLLELHEWLRFDEKNYRRAIKWRSGSLEQTQPRVPLKQTIRFDKHVHGGGPALDLRDIPEPTLFEPWIIVSIPFPVPPFPFPFPPFPVLPFPVRQPLKPPPNWCDYWDRHGVTNKTKIKAVFDAIHKASLLYLRLYFPKLAHALDFGTGPTTDKEWINGVFTPLKWDPGSAEDDAYHAKLARSFVARETYLVDVVGYTDTDGLAEDDRKIGLLWASEVAKALLDMNSNLPEAKRIFELERRLVVVSRGGANPTYDQATALGRNLSNRVEFTVVEQVLPGEHGFRFFPAFYRNLFDTMRRTPVFDRDGDISETAFDQLVPTPQPAIAAGLGKQPEGIEPKLTSFWQLDQALKLLRNELGFTFSDLFGLQFYMLRFLTSCGERREREAEPVDTMTYMGGKDPSLRFSQAAIEFLANAPRALAAMSATELDARTQLDVAAQLLMVNLFGPQPDNMTLNGPTSKAWLDHWKAYLINQGVRFYVGELKAFAKIGEHLVPAWNSGGPTPEDPTQLFVAPKDADDIGKFRFVTAMSFQKTSDLLWTVYDEIEKTDGPFQQFLEFEERVGRRKRPSKGSAGGPIPPMREPATGRENKTYPLRTISGAQLFFEEDYRFGVGNVYFARTPWDLTSISQLSYWQDLVNPLGQFHGQLSIDIGAWHVFAARDRGRPTRKSSPDAPNAPNDHDNTAWYSSASEIVNGVWAQERTGFATPYQMVVRPPRYAHLDKNIVFSVICDPAPASSAVLRLDTTKETIDPPIDAYLNIDVAPGDDPNLSSASVEDTFDKIALSQVPMKIALSQVPMAISGTWPKVVATQLEDGEAARSQKDAESREWVKFDILVAPWVQGNSITVVFRPSKQPYHLWLVVEDSGIPSPDFLRGGDCGRDCGAAWRIERAGRRLPRGQRQPLRVRPELGQPLSHRGRQCGGGDFNSGRPATGDRRAGGPAIGDPPGARQSDPSPAAAI